MMDAPRVSVVIPVFNAARFLPAAIESILGQSLDDFELILVDDGSEDGSEDMMADYLRKDRRVRCAPQERQGAAQARNRGMRLARGRYLAWLDADDRAHPHRLAEQVAFLETHTDIVILGSAFRQMDEFDRVSQVHTLPLDDTSIRWHALFHSPFAQSSLMQRLDVLRHHRLEYRPYAGTEDYDLSTRMLAVGRGWNLARPLIDYRIHPAQVSQSRLEQIAQDAVQIARRNILQVGADLSEDVVQQLRSWFYHYPQRFTQADLSLACTLLNLVDTFGRRPGLDAHRVREIRGRLALRFLRAVAKSPGVWRSGVGGCMRADRIAAAMVVGYERLLGRRG